MKYLDKQIVMILKPPSRGSILRKPDWDITYSTTPHIDDNNHAFGDYFIQREGSPQHVSTFIRLKT